MHPKDSEIRNMIKEADVSKTGTIDFTEFVGVLTRYSLSVLRPCPSFYLA
jgi:Ca2+-binding EF-hand superfamily protein